MTWRAISASPQHDTSRHVVDQQLNFVSRIEWHPVTWRAISASFYAEEDDPNFGGSFYSETKSYMEMMVRNYPNVLQLRLRMPIDGDLSNPRNFITKIANYAKVRTNSKHPRHIINHL
jgi:hypothetical protein